MQFLGCLFFFVFGIFFIFVAFGKAIFNWAYRQLFKRAFGIDPGATGPQARQHPRGGNAYASHQRATDEATYDSTARHSGNAHHEGHSHGNSRQRRSGKIFSQNEGTYVDFEDVHD